MRFDFIFSRKSAQTRRTERKTSISVEPLEGRALLSGPGASSIYPPPTPTPPPIMVPTPAPTPGPTSTPVTVTPAPVTPVSISRPKTPAPASHPKKAEIEHKPTGIVTKAPHFYQFYTGPKLAELNAVRASAELSPNGTFTFTGTVRGAINKAPAVYVWGIDRDGNLPAGPFTDRPDIKFDAVVVVSLDSALAPTATVDDLASGTSTVLPSSSVSIRGRTVEVNVSGSLLPSTGLASSRYRFNFWPEDGGPLGSASVSSFVPEFTTAQVGTSK